MTRSLWLDRGTGRSLKQLLTALEKQHFEGRAPGKYRYSQNVLQAMSRARSLVPKAVRLTKTDRAESV